MMYLCNECFKAFEEPNTIYEKVDTQVGVEVYTTTECPHCGGSEYAKADYCRCGYVKFKSDILCYGCRRTLAAKFKAFADELTAEEEEQMDNWLDGNSVTDWRKFE